VDNHLFKGLRSACWAATAAMAITTAHADATIEQKTTLDVASMIRSHGSSTTNITADKKREDSESHCEGMLSLVCGNIRGGEIVRLDRGLTWRLRPEKKTYAEEVFATPEELAEMRAKIQARLEKMRSCPVPQRQQPIDKSKCEMSAPKIDVHKTEDRMSIAGHDTQRTLATLTETCTNKDTGDVCDTVVAVDVWLTQDKIPGAGDRREFQRAYAKRLGLVDEQGAMSSEVSKFLAPYQSQIKQLTDKSSDLKGQPLKTSLRVMMGGRQCSAVSKMQANGSAAGGGTAGGNPAGSVNNPITNVAQAGKAIGSSVGNMVGSLFHKKKTDDSQAPAGAATPSDAAAGASTSPPTASTPDPFAQYVQMASFTTETVTINADPVPADRFDIPPDWKKDAPKSAKQGDDEFTCPKTGD
jgi:hypothetical protein